MSRLFFIGLVGLPPTPAPAKKIICKDSVIATDILNITFIMGSKYGKSIEVAKECYVPVFFLLVYFCS